MVTFLRVALYGRVSTQKQEFLIQKEKLRANAKSKDWTVYGEYYDKWTGKDEKRPRLDELFADAEKQAFKVVLVTKIDRIARSLSDLMSIMERLRKVGVKFSCVDQPIDTTTPHGKLIFQILGAVAEFERTLILERTREGIERAKAMGKVCNRPRKVIDEKELRDYYLNKKLTRATIAKIFKVSATTIANRLKESGLE